MAAVNASDHLMGWSAIHDEDDGLRSEVDSGLGADDDIKALLSECFGLDADVALAAANALRSRYEAS